MLEIRWLGAAGLEINLDGTIVLIDPYLSRVGFLSLIFRRLNPVLRKVRAYTGQLCNEVSAIICGHTHFDHAMDIPAIVRSIRCTLIGSTSLKSLMEISGVNPEIRVCRGGERIDLGRDLSVRMFRSTHGPVMLGRVPYQGEIDPHDEMPLKASQYRVGTMFMPKLEAGGVTLIHAGSAGFIQSEIEGQKCEILFMCVPGWKSVAGYTSKFLDMVKPEVIVPFHFDDFTAPISRSGKVRVMPRVDLKGFVDDIKKYAPGAVIRVPTLNEVMRF